MVVVIVLSLGSNLGHRLHNLQRAYSLIEGFFEIKIASHVIETEALLLPGSPDAWNMPFLNMLIAGHSDLEPLELLDKLQMVERIMGRGDHEQWSPRIIDLDIIYYHDRKMNTERLILPHVGVEDREYLQYLLRELEMPIPSYADQIQYKPLNHMVCFPKLIGVINVTPDSFSDGGKYIDKEKAIARFEELQSDGATIVELGGQSTRPSYKEISASEEWSRLATIFDAIGNKYGIGLDTFHDEVVKHAIKYKGLCWIIDVENRFSPDTIRLIADHDIKLVALLRNMHDMNKFEKQIERLLQCGMKQSNIIVDPGIGFEKTAWESISAIRHIDSLRKFGCEIVLAHSRKSFISNFSNEPTENRDLETIAISMTKHADYIRVHNVKDHMRAMVAAHIVRR